MVDSELKFHLVTCCNRQSFEDENSSHRALPNLLAFTLSATVSARKAIVKQSVEVNHSVDQSETRHPCNFSEFQLICNPIDEVNGGLGRPDAMQSEVEVSTEEVGTAVVNKSPGPFDYGDDNNFGAVGVDENNNFARWTSDQLSSTQSGFKLRILIDVQMKPVVDLLTFNCIFTPVPTWKHLSLVLFLQIFMSLSFFYQFCVLCRFNLIYIWCPVAVFDFGRKRWTDYIFKQTTSTSYCILARQTSGSNWLKICQIRRHTSYAQLRSCAVMKFYRR